MPPRGEPELAEESRWPRVTTGDDNPTYDPDLQRDTGQAAEMSAADHEPGEVAERVARAELDVLYARVAFTYRQIDEADGHHTAGELRAHDEALEAVGAWLRQHDAEVAANALESLAARFASKSNAAMLEYAGYPEATADRDARERTWEAAGGQGITEAER